MSARFSGKVALVAGGTGGLGGAVSLAFLEEDANVVVTYRKHEEFDALKSAAGASGLSPAHSAKCDDQIRNVTIRYEMSRRALKAVKTAPDQLLMES